MSLAPPNPAARILVVDDQPANLQVLGSVLGRLGYDIVSAGDGETALKRLALRPPDLVLLDLLMPGMDGFEVCRRIRENPAWADLPIIFLSAADDKALIVRALECGGVDYVTKPFNQAELLSRLRTHLALKAARDRLAQLAEDKDELLGILAHDLKNALGSVLISAELLAGRTAGDPKLHPASNNIFEATERTLAFVRQFLANSSAERSLPTEAQPVSLVEAARQVVGQHLSSARRKELTLQMSEPSADIVVLADSAALRQVLDNLVSNAVKFSPSGRAIEVSFQEDGDQAECRVRDEGPGFTTEDRAKMFRRYGRLSARPTAGEPSTGLGLSIAKRLVEGQRGELLCESQPGNGATFRVRLPLGTA